jgi:Ca2+-binding EF-hand superfamily protein
MTRKIFIAALSAAVLAGSLGTAALARPRDRAEIPPMARPGVYVFMLKNFDENKDGKVTADEAKAGAGTLFTAIDTDKDGSATPKEMRTWRQAKMADMRKAMGGETAAADDEGPDAGGPDETAKADGPGKHHGWHKGFRHHGKGHGMMGRGMMRMIDSDENGQVSKAEAEAAADKAFKQMDTNGDSTVSIDDFPA